MKAFGYKICFKGQLEPLHLFIDSGDGRRQTDRQSPRGPVLDAPGGRHTVSAGTDYHENRCSSQTHSVYDTDRLFQGRFAVLKNGFEFPQNFYAHKSVIQFQRKWRHNYRKKEKIICHEQ